MLRPALFGLLNYIPHRRTLALKRWQKIRGLSTRLNLGPFWRGPKRWIPHRELVGWLVRNIIRLVPINYFESSLAICQWSVWRWIIHKTVCSWVCPIFAIKTSGTRVLTIYGFWLWSKVQLQTFRLLKVFGTMSSISGGFAPESQTSTRR
jgi:hypothetical protein